MRKKPNILICPLDWGIGHATRCIPIINELIHQNANVIIGADNQPYSLLKKEYPQLQFIRFPGYKFFYPENDKMALKMAIQSPAILSGIKSENRLLKNLIKKFHIDAVISDNRFGLYNDDVPSIFITHQIFIKAPPNFKFFEPILYKLNKRFILKYNECWIPDWENGFTLSGDLSHQKAKIPNSYFIGPLSRFGRHKNENKQQDYIYDFAIVMSGPEPQRTIFETMVMEQIDNLSGRGVVVLGKPESDNSKIKTNERYTVYPHLGSDELEDVIINSKIIICRPGYSSIMDLVVLGKQAIFIPTPGQTEQEYLADYYFKNGLYLKMFQYNFDLRNVLEEVDKFPGLKKEYDPATLKDRIRNLLSKI